jgi:hypothetical protein
MTGLNVLQSRLRLDLCPVLLSDSEVPILYSIGIYTSCVSFRADVWASSHYAMKNAMRYLLARKTRYRRVADPYRIKTSGISHLPALGVRQQRSPGYSIRRRQAWLDVPTFHALPKLPHCRHDTARAKRVDGDGGIKAAICGGALAARHACVGGCKPERYHSVMSFFSGGLLIFHF